MRAVVVGGGGIGAAISDTLKASPNVGEVICLSRRPSADVSMDVTDLTSIALAAEAVKARGPLDLVFVATGVLHDDEVSPEKNLSALDPLAMAHLYQVNTIGPAMVAKHFLPLLVRGGSRPLQRSPRALAVLAITGSAVGTAIVRRRRR